MTKILFNVTSWSVYSAIWVSDRMFAFWIWIFSNLAFLHRKNIAKYGMVLMHTVAPEEAEQAQAQLELENQQTELNLLATVSKLKEHALEIDDWTDQHTEAIQAIGNALMVECNWEEEDVHHYLKGVVESIPGLSYGTDDSEDDPLY